jgi:NAD(P)-dependent dehydrogenase (short-subunit alcohol dehydrogenase family)
LLLGYVRSTMADAIGRMDAVIHNAGIYIDDRRVAPPEGTRALAVNVLAPYVLTATSGRPCRPLYISSGMHRGGGGMLGVPAERREGLGVRGLRQSLARTPLAAEPAH